MRVLLGIVFLLAILGVPCLVRAGIAAMFEVPPTRTSPPVRGSGVGRTVDDDRRPARFPGRVE